MTATNSTINESIINTPAPLTSVPISSDLNTTTASTINNGTTDNTATIAIQSELKREGHATSIRGNTCTYAYTCTGNKGRATCYNPTTTQTQASHFSQS